MARVKSVVPETVREDGFAILNAEDDLVYKMKEDLECNVALFSMDENNPRIKKHCKEGGYAAVYENGYVTILKGTWKIRVLKVTDIPITLDGKALHNIMNTLPAVLATYLFRDITIEDIRTGLSNIYSFACTNTGKVKYV